MSELNQSGNIKNLLPEDLGDTPFDIVSSWLDEATKTAWQPNPNAMVLSTVSEITVKDTAQASVFDNDALEEKAFMPDARVVLCKSMNPEKGYLVFYTNYQSAKASQLKKHPQATAVFHWDNLGRQIRISGQVVRSPVMESENYFNSRDLRSRIGAWTSDQSQPIESRQALLDKLEEHKNRFEVAGENIPRPPHWGGYRLWATKVELWIAQPNRIHDRAVYTRELTDIQKDHFHFTAWQATRLQP